MGGELVESYRELIPWQASVLAIIASWVQGHDRTTRADSLFYCYHSVRKGFSKHSASSGFPNEMNTFALLSLFMMRFLLLLLLLLCFVFCPC